MYFSHVTSQRFRNCCIMGTATDAVQYQIPVGQDAPTFATAGRELAHLYTELKTRYPNLDKLINKTCFKADSQCGIQPFNTETDDYWDIISTIDYTNEYYNTPRHLRDIPLITTYHDTGMKTTLCFMNYRIAMLMLTGQFKKIDPRQFKLTDVAIHFWTHELFLAYALVHPQEPNPIPKIWKLKYFGKHGIDEICKAERTRYTDLYEEAYTIAMATHPIIVVPPLDKQYQDILFNKYVVSQKCFFYGRRYTELYVPYEPTPPDTTTNPCLDIDQQVDINSIPLSDQRFYPAILTCSILPIYCIEPVDEPLIDIETFRKNRIDMIFNEYHESMEQLRLHNQEEMAQQKLEESMDQLHLQKDKPEETMAH